MSVFPSAAVNRVVLGAEFTLALFLLPTAIANAQTLTTRFSALPAAPAQGSAAAQDESAEPHVRIQDLPRRVTSDQKAIWSFPAKVITGQHWKPVIIFVAGTAALVALDPHDAPYFRRTQRFNGFDRVFSTRNTAIGEAIFPVALYLDGITQKQPYAETSGLEAGEALIDSQIVAIVLKNMSRRLTPGEVHNGDFTHTWWKAGGGLLIKRGSFPSGHTIGAFSIATVVSERYHQDRWVSWIAYGSAATIGFSRLTLQAHFPSDVFAGAVFGYSLSHFVVLRNH
jgi:membrane-associated phospholipid phosphatase